jgi:hypothetical protein
MPVNVDEAFARLGLMHDMSIPNLIVEGFSHCGPYLVFLLAGFIPLLSEYLLLPPAPGKFHQSPAIARSP